MYDALSYLWDLEEQRGGGRGGDALKSSFGMAMQATTEGSFYGKGRFSLRNTAALKLYCKSYWVL